MIDDLLSDRVAVTIYNIDTIFSNLIFILVIVMDVTTAVS